MPKDPRSGTSVRAGQRLTSSLWNRMVESARNCVLRFVPPLHHDESSGNVTFDITVLGGRIAKTGASGIPAATGSPPTPGVATCTLYRFKPGTAVRVAEADKVYTLTTAVAANTYIIVMRVEGSWFVVVELCPV